jgi:hypothetical protein
MVMACAGAVMLLTRLGGVRTTHSGLVGAMLGPLFAVATVTPALPRVAGVSGTLAVVFGGVLLLALVGLVGARVAAREEGKGGRPASAGLTWAGASLLLAGLAWNLYGDGTGNAWLAHASIPVGAAVGGAALLGRAPRGPRGPRTHFGGLLAVLGAAATAAPFWPWWLPWLLTDQYLPDLGRWPPNLLFVVLEGPRARQGASAEQSPTLLEVLAVDAVAYRSLSPEAEVRSLLTLPDGSPLAGHLYAAGYATAAVGTVPENLRELGVAEVDARPGGRRLLEQSAAWMAGAPLLLGPASGLLALLGHDQPLRSPKLVGDEAARWLLNWRARRSPAPFFLFVDLRASDAGAEDLDAGLRPVLERLEALQLDPITLLVIAVENRAIAGPGASLRALVLPPSSWPRAPRLEVPAQVWGRALSQSLLEVALSDGASPVGLPGLDEQLAPPKVR